MDDLFTDSDFAWSIRMRRDEPAAFFASQDESGDLLRERNHWLGTRAELCLSQTAATDPIARELWDLALAWGQVRDAGDRSLRALTGQWEADLILLEVESFRVAGGAVCFPSSWDLQEATGKTLTEVHGVVPELNDQLGSKIERFLQKLAPGQTFLRENWGLTRTADLSYHPALQRPRLDDQVTLAGAWLRIEHQAFVRLPTAVLLGVRIEPVCLEALISEAPETARRLRRLLETMPDAVADYKGLRAALPRLVELLTRMV